VHWWSRWNHLPCTFWNLLAQTHLPLQETLISSPRRPVALQVQTSSVNSFPWPKPTKLSSLAIATARIIQFWGGMPQRCRSWSRCLSHLFWFNIYLIPCNSQFP
jgi:hypothetical protein